MVVIISGRDNIPHSIVDGVSSVLFFCCVIHCGLIDLIYRMVVVTVVVIVMNKWAGQ